MELTLDLAAVEGAVVDRAVDRFFDEHYDFNASLSGAIQKRLDALFAERAEAKLNEAIDAALKDAFNREYHKKTAWGEPEGATTLSKEMANLFADFWQQKVDKQGKPTTSYGSTTRLEYFLVKAAGDDFMRSLEQYLVGSAAHLKDSLRDTLRGKVDEMLGNLFHVKTQQDKAEGRYK